MFLSYEEIYLQTPIYFLALLTFIRYYISVDILSINLGVAKMEICYNNLFKMLIDKGLRKTEFAKEVGISANTLAKLSRKRHQMRLSIS